MSAYPLQDMVRVRSHREEQASQAVTRARRLLEEARAVVLRLQKELDDYRTWRVHEERRLLDSLMRRLLKLGEISDVRQTIVHLREREFEMIDAVKQAEAAVTKAEVQLEECRGKHIKAVRDLEKLLEHRLVWLSERALEQEMAEDLELEDFSSPRLDRAAA